jgi:hypothetical protein
MGRRWLPPSEDVSDEFRQLPTLPPPAAFTRVPVETYRALTTLDERQRFETCVILVYRPLIQRLMRRLAVSHEHWDESEQIGAMGLIVALVKFDPERVCTDIDAAFSFFAARYIRDEIRTWLAQVTGDLDGPDGDDGEPIPADDASMRRAA